MQTERLLVLLDRIFDVAFFDLNDAEIVVGHPTTWICRNGRSPERFQIVIRRALSPRQHTQETQNREASGDHGPLQGLARPAQGHEAGRGERDWANAGQVLVMVRYECVAKSVKHDKAEQRAQRHHKKQCRHFDAATEKAATVKDQHNSDGHSDRPQVSNRIRGINPPLRINKRELCRPKYLAEVKPNSPTRDQQSLDRSEGDKHPCALMIFFPPNGHQTDTEREDNERNDFQERTAADRPLF